ncbi:MAG: DUF4232 domain-containing protein [Actinomycetota bacterium]|nr:DUF4232 domain-containing protein [Actinomycetota bacterium]MDQ6945926.1 DUF4232 domain-containing protein [Actinomycetota bacterium]
MPFARFPRLRARSRTLRAVGVGLTSLMVISTGLFSPAQASAASTPPTIAFGSQGSLVRTWQSARGCTTGQLRARLGRPDGAAGSVFVPLTLTNTGSTTCVTGGYPGVSYVTGDAGTQVGSAAVRSASFPPSIITLAPGRSATARVREVNALNFPPASCHLTATRGLRVYPPERRAALFVPSTGQACANPADTWLSVTVLQPG